MKPEKLTRAQRYYRKNADLIKQKARQKRLSNPAVFREAEAKWRELNPDKVKEKEKRRHLPDRVHVVRAKTARRRVARINGQIAGYSSQIREIYRSCPSGKEVDHIVPLQEKNVCGLHVPWNLQHLEAKLNCRKRCNIVAGTEIDYSAPGWR